MANVTKKSIRNETRIMKCECVHESQDKLHGKNNRVHNGCAGPGMRCTVCVRVKSV